jgi:DNA invertase Pin-like site-specific DNA recombinase
MTPEQVVEHFGGKAETAAALNVTRQVVYLWLKKQKIPEPRAYQIQVITKGKLKVSHNG